MSEKYIFSSSLLRPISSFPHQNQYELWQISPLDFLPSFCWIIPSTFSLYFYYLKTKLFLLYLLSHFSPFFLFFFYGKIPWNHCLSSLYSIHPLIFSLHPPTHSQDNPTPNRSQASSDIHMAHVSCQSSLLNSQASLYEIFSDLAFGTPSFTPLVMSLSLVAFIYRLNANDFHVNICLNSTFVYPTAYPILLYRRS